MDRFLCVAIISFALIACSSNNDEPETSNNNPDKAVEATEAVSCAGLTLGFENMNAERIDPSTSEDQFGKLNLWESVMGNTSSTLHGQNGYPTTNEGQGSRLFTGGFEETSVSQQTVTLDANVAGCSFVFSTEIGGFETQEDNASVAISFIGSAGDNLATLTLGPVSADDRDSESVLLPLETNGSIPANATQARITITQNRLSGTANDGYVDNIVLALL